MGKRRKRMPSECLASPEAHYDPARGCYWIRNDRGGYVTVNETSLRRLLRIAGVSPIRPRDVFHSPLDQKLSDLQLHHEVEYAGPLAGYLVGLHVILNRRVLVTEPPVLIEPRPEAFPLLQTIITNLLNDPEFDQRPYFYGWMKVAVETLRAAKRRPGQALAIAGPPDCGKSLLQNLITLLLGGRMAKPYQFMTGVTPFNFDLFAAEHQMVEDEAASTDIRARRIFGAFLKNITVNEVQRCHPKNRHPFSLTPFWRLTISVNDEPENLMVLPPIDNSIEDKLMLFKAHKKPMPARTRTLAERTAFWNALVAELPAFVDFLLQWEIPVELRSERFGVTHFHHPEILAAIDALAPERRLLSLIDAELFSANGESASWSGTAEELESKLTNKNCASAYEARRLFSFNTACGVYLGRLAKKFPAQFSEHRHRHGRIWTIQPPHVEEA